MIGALCILYIHGIILIQHSIDDLQDEINDDGFGPTPPEETDTHTFPSPYQPVEMADWFPLSCTVTVWLVKWNGRKLSMEVSEAASLEVDNVS